MSSAQLHNWCVHVHESKCGSIFQDHMHAYDLWTTGLEKDSFLLKSHPTHRFGGARRPWLANSGSYASGALRCLRTCREISFRKSLFGLLVIWPLGPMKFTMRWPGLTHVPGGWINHLVEKKCETDPIFPAFHLVMQWVHLAACLMFGLWFVWRAFDDCEAGTISWDPSHYPNTVWSVVAFDMSSICDREIRWTRFIK